MGREADRDKSREGGRSEEDRRSTKDGGQKFGRRETDTGQAKERGLDAYPRTEENRSRG